MIVITILAILLLTALLSYNKERDKALDAKSKSELNRLKIAFEDYYNDHNCYPPAAWFDNTNDCGSASLTPYISQMPCDPRTDKPYVLETDSPTCGTWFKLYGQLQQTASDPEVLELCGVSGSLLGTYGVSSSNTTVTINCDNIPTPTPIPTIPPHAEGSNSCTPQQGCQDYILPYKCDLPSDPCCKVSFSDSNLAECNSYCLVAPADMLCAR